MRAVPFIKRDHSANLAASSGELHHASFGTSAECAIEARNAMIKPVITDIVAKAFLASGKGFNRKNPSSGSLPGGEQGEKANVGTGIHNDCFNALTGIHTS